MCVECSIRYIITYTAFRFLERYAKLTHIKKKLLAVIYATTSKIDIGYITAFFPGFFMGT